MAATKDTINFLDSMVAQIVEQTRDIEKVWEISTEAALVKYLEHSTAGKTAIAKARLVLGLGND
jgi:hypothetical protein